MPSITLAALAALAALVALITPYYPEGRTGCMPDESIILRFRHRLEKHKLTDAILATVNGLLSS